VPRTQLKPMVIGQIEKVHVKAYAADPNNNPSQIVDLVTPMLVSLVQAGVVSVAIDGGDPRLVVVTALAGGSATIIVNESPALLNGVPQLLDVTVASPPPDNRRIDVIAIDDPV
jgi:hypothetical protein